MKIRPLHDRVIVKRLEEEAGHRPGFPGGHFARELVKFRNEEITV